MGQFLEMPLGLFGRCLKTEKHGKVRILRFKERSWQNALGYLEANLDQKKRADVSI
jgi:hypothetical protein